MYHYIYCIENLINGKVYVGKHSTDDMNDSYMGSGTRLQAAIKKHGIENFRKYVLMTCVSSEEAFEFERLIVNEQFIQDENTYNLTEGGNGFSPGSKRATEAGRKGGINSTASDETRAKKARLCGEINRRLNPERNRRLWRLGMFPQPTFKGKKHSDSAKHAIGVANAISQRGERNSQHGTVWIFHPQMKIAKKIRRHELEAFLAEGWIKGRKQKS